MAKKKSEEKELSYLQMPLTSGQKRQRMTRLSWCGLNRRRVTDTGVLSMEQNISTADPPYLIPSQKRKYKENDNFCGTQDFRRIPLYMYGFGPALIAVYWQQDTKTSTNGKIKLDYIADTENGPYLYTGVLKNGVTETDAKAEPQRCIVKFNVYDSNVDAAGGTFDEKFLILPDKYSMNADLAAIQKDGLDLVPLEPKKTDNGQENLAAIPDLSYATVHLSRVFGVGKGRIYASHFNNYADWTLDTADEYNEANAWCSETQANAKAEGDFVGITAFQNHVICFKRDFMHEIYNNKNPFRVQDIYADGCIDNRSIQDVNSRLFFVSRDGVKNYTGKKPEDVGRELGIDRFDKAVGGSDGRRYYLYCESGGEKHLFVFDTVAGQWAEEGIDMEIVSFAHNQNGMFALGADGYIYRLDTGEYDHSWAFETDFMTAGSMDIKRVQKLQLYAEIPQGSWMKTYILYGDEQFHPGGSQLVYDSAGRHGMCPVRVLVRKSASYGFKLRFEGFGYVRLYEMELDLTGGGELYV